MCAKKDRKEQPAGERTKPQYVSVRDVLRVVATPAWARRLRHLRVDMLDDRKNDAENER
jgi:hypothetical protein